MYYKEVSNVATATCMLYTLYIVLCHVHYTCRSLYDENEQDEFMKSLFTRIKQHEKDIERMCNKNYQVFYMCTMYMYV